MVEHTNLDSATSFHSAQNDRGIKQQEDVNISVADYPQSTAIIIVDEPINTLTHKKYTC